MHTLARTPPSLTQYGPDLYLLFGFGVRLNILSALWLEGMDAAKGRCKEVGAGFGAMECSTFGCGFGGIKKRGKGPLHGGGRRLLLGWNVWQFEMFVWAHEPGLF